MAAGSAHAEPTWAAVDLSVVEGLHIPRPDGWTSGITADFKGGLVRVYIGPSDVAASWWVQRMTQVVEKQKPAAVPFPSPTAPPDPGSPPPVVKMLDSADELYSAGDRLVIARLGNVGVMVEVSSGARAKAEAVTATLMPAAEVMPLPKPSLVKTGSEWRIDVPLTEPPLQVRYEGGQLSGAPGLTFRRPPSTAVVYDTQGRMARQDFDAMGLVIERPPLWLDHEPVVRPPAESMPSPEPK